MFDFGIENYRPQWLTDRLAVTADHGSYLRALVGRPLTGLWLVWESRDDEWFSDCPVLLDFAGEQVEINHQKFDELSITWNTIDPHRPVRWPCGDFELRWRLDERAESRELQGQTIQDVELLEWTGDDMGRGTLALGFRFPHGRLTVANALDENLLIFGTPRMPYRRHSLP
ncbi:MAG: hypothetical protein ACRD0P_12390 [Stackebrandtia sp.]